RILCNDLLSCIQQLPIEIIKHLRKELSFNFLSHHKIQDSFTIKPNSSGKTLSKDIFNITHISVKSDPLAENDLFPFFKKITQSPKLLDENDLDIFTSIQEMYLDAQHTKKSI
ncbi:unnamed protein product, partial [Brachionus calyciflorus]